MVTCKFAFNAGAIGSGSLGLYIQALRDPASGQALAEKAEHLQLAVGKEH
jgi:hypothetical protein